MHPAKRRAGKLIPPCTESIFAGVLCQLQGATGRLVIQDCCWQVNVYTDASCSPMSLQTIYFENDKRCSSWAAGKPSTYLLPGSCRNEDQGSPLIFPKTGY